MGNKIPELDWNVSGKNGINRRDAISRGMWAIMASLLGTGALPAQDNAVAVVTNPQNIPGRSLETVAAQSWFAKTITWLQWEMVALQVEFKKWNIDSKKMEELLTKLLVNEKTITVEVQKTLDIIFERLWRTYKLLWESDKRRAEIKELGNTITNLKAGLSEWDNLIKGVRFIHELCSNEKYRNETSTLNKSYFKWMIEYIDTTIGWIIDGITKYEWSFQAMPTEEIKELKWKLNWMKNSIASNDLEPKKGELTIKIEEKDKGGQISLNRGFATLSKGGCKIENWMLVMNFNEARDGYAGMTDGIKLPEKSKKINLSFKYQAEIKAGSIIPLYLVFIDTKDQTISDLPITKEKNTGIVIPKWTAGLKICFGTLRNKATGNAKVWEIKIDIK